MRARRQEMGTHPSKRGMTFSSTIANRSTDSEGGISTRFRPQIPGGLGHQCESGFTGKLENSPVDVGVGFEHPLAAAKIESTFAGTVAQTRRQRGIVQKTGERGGERGSVSGTECETRIAQDLNEGAKIGGDYRQGPQHIFRGNQTENFSAQRRHHDDGRLYERRIEQHTVETAGETNLRIQLRLAGELLQRSALRPVADDQEFERLFLPAQDARSFEQQSHTFGGNEPSLKRKNRWNVALFGAWRCFDGFEPMRDCSGLRKMQLAAEPSRGSDIGGNAFAKKAAHVSKDPKLKRGEPSLLRIAPETFRLASGHEVAGTGHTGWFKEQLAVGANRLKSVMLDDARLSRQQAQNKGCDRRTGNVHDVTRANELPELKETGCADRSKCICTVVVVS